MNNDIYLFNVLRWNVSKIFINYFFNYRNNKKIQLKIHANSTSKETEQRDTKILNKKQHTHSYHITSRSDKYYVHLSITNWIHMIMNKNKSKKSVYIYIMHKILISQSHIISIKSRPICITKRIKCIICLSLS